MSHFSQEAVSEDDGFSLCSEKISQDEARLLLTESEQRISVIMSSFETSNDSFLDHERRLAEEAAAEEGRNAVEDRTLSNSQIEQLG